MASLTCHLCGKSLIGLILKQETLMRSILEIFIENADIHMEELIDKLISMGVLQTRHHELITDNMDRRHRARKLWNLLLRRPPKDFKEHVEPLLEELGFFQHQKTVHLKNRMCLRCVMESLLPVEEFADKLMAYGCLRSTEYRDVVKSNTLELHKWPVIFKCLQREHADYEVVKICEELLKEFDIPVPGQMAAIFSGGTACACNIQLNTARNFQKEVFQSLGKDRVSG